MKKLTINRARALGKDMNAKGIVILAFGDDGEFQACSYGRTKQDCGQLGEWLDTLYDAIESGEAASPFVEQQSPERLTGPAGSESVSSEPPFGMCDGELREASRRLAEDWIPAGHTPPYVQSGMVIKRREGGPRLTVEFIEDLKNPTAACRSGVGKAVRIPCSEIRSSYMLVESFTP